MVEQLQQLWRIRVAETQDSVSIIAYESWTLLIWLVCYQVLSILFVALDPNWEPNYSTLETFIGGLFTLWGFVRIMKWLTFNSNSAFRKRMKVGDAVPLVGSKYEPILNQFNYLISQMKIKDSPSLWLDLKNFSESPSVFVINKLPHVVLPVGFLSAWEKDNGAASAILAHELSHVAQDDVDNWQLPTAVSNLIGIFMFLPLTSLMSKIMLALSLPLLVLGAFAFPDDPLLPSIYDIAIALTTYFLCGRFYLSVRKNRHRSEFTADLAAAAFVDPTAIDRALENTKIKEEQDLSLTKKNFSWLKYIPFINGEFVFGKHRRHLRVHPMSEKRQEYLETQYEILEEGSIPENPRIQSPWSTAAFRSLLWIFPFLPAFILGIRAIYDIARRKERYGVTFALIATLIGFFELIVFGNLLWEIAISKPSDFELTRQQLNLYLLGFTMIPVLGGTLLSLPFIIVARRAEKRFRDYGF